VFSIHDTIVAVATPPGRGGIGVVRISGAEARAVAARLIGSRRGLKARHATLVTISVAGITDHVVATAFRAPRSYTGEDVVELSAHGSPVVLRAIVAAAIEAGARLAEPGEFTLRAFLNGRLDLPQAEAVADLVDAVTPLQARVAFDQLSGTLTRAIRGIDEGLFDLTAKLEASIDFPDEGYHFLDPAEVAGALDALRARALALLTDARRGRLVREGCQVAIVGEPNVGKSSLFNALVGASRAIVADTPGTTRDLVTETVDLDGLRVTLVDTAGRRDAADLIEAEGVSRAAQAEAVADLVLVVVDTAADLAFAGRDARRLLVLNKIDRLKVGSTERDAAEAAGASAVSCTTGEGLDALRRRMSEAVGARDAVEPPPITNVRHIALVERAAASLERARDAAARSGGALSEEFVLADLQDARAALEEISGKRTPDDLLSHIFSKFCIGK
jgi:tRNA modification GTPase